MPDTDTQTIPIPAGFRMPTYDEMIVKLQTLASERSEWAGLPMLVNGLSLRVEPRYPYQFRECSNHDVDESVPDVEYINGWWCDKLMAFVDVYRENGKLKHFVHYQRGGRLGTKLIETINATHAWLWEAEFKAMNKLAEMVEYHTFKHYVMTGSFLEKSPRSKITYLFRRLRPTLALSGATGQVHILCALCLHPIGYYEKTHCGCMVPTDEVIAHLSWVRGDEHGFWKQSGQHQPNRPEAGL